MDFQNGWYSNYPLMNHQAFSHWYIRKNKQKVALILSRAKPECKKPRYILHDKITSWIYLITPWNKT